MVKPSIEVMETVTTADPPCTTESEVGPTLMAKSGGAAVTVSVSETIADQLSAASRALTSIVWVPFDSAGVVNVKLTDRAGVNVSTSAQVPLSTLYSMSTTFVNASVAVPE